MDAIFWSGGIISDVLIRSVGPYKIAYWIRKHRHSAQVIDFIDKLTEEQLYSVTKKFIMPTTKILGISTTFFISNSFKWNDGTEQVFPEHCVNVIKRIKEEYPYIKIIFGGHGSDKVAGWGSVDATVMSYENATEDTFLEYLEHLKTGSPPPFSQIILPYWDVKHRILYDRARNPKYNIEEDDFKWHKNDAILTGEPLPLDISRGCIFSCKFCQYQHIGKKKFDYIRGMKFIEDELIYNYENFGTTYYYLLDDTFNDSEFKVQEFHKMTQRLPFKIRYNTYLRADLIHRFPSMAPLLQESGLLSAFHGIETFHPDASKLIGKAWSGKYAKSWLPELYHNIWNKKIAMHTNFIVGITGDTRENVFDTVKWYFDNDMHSIGFYHLGLFGTTYKRSRFYPESEFDKNAEKYGFTFTGEPNANGFRPWKNDNWTNLTAYNTAIEVNAMISDHTKIATRSLAAACWYGIPEEDIINKPISQYFDLKEKTAKLCQEYFDKLMSLR